VGQVAEGAAELGAAATVEEVADEMKKKAK
jgi:hypothetical protein